MSNSETGISLREAALVAGFGLLAMTIFAVTAIYFVFPKLVVPDDATLTVNNIIANEILFRIGIGSLAIVAILDLVVAWALYIFLEPVNRGLSLLAAWFRLVYATMLGTALFNYLGILQIPGGANYLTAIDAKHLHADIMISINAFDDSWALGLQFFGLHLVFLGYLVFRADYMPRILGLVLIVAGFAYMIDNIGIILLPDYNLKLAAFAGWGELLLMLWLLLKGVKL